jgi:hypothetical protein
MNPNPLADVVGFLTQPGWTTVVFWLLLVASIAIAAYALASNPEQRRFGHVAQWVLRFLIGAMWWQQTLWSYRPTIPTTRSSRSATPGWPTG